MMALGFRLVLIFAVFSLCYGWIGIIESSGNHKSHCYTNEFKLGEMHKNEHRRVKGLCAEAVCEETKRIKISGCAPVAARPPCKVLDGNISLPFPDCCYTIICDENDVKTNDISS